MGESLESAGARFARHSASKVTEIKVEWGQAVDPHLVADALKKDPAIKAVYVQASETSTGVSHDVKALGEIVKAL